MSFIDPNEGFKACAFRLEGKLLGALSPELSVTGDIPLAASSSQVLIYGVNENRLQLLPSEGAQFSGCRP